MKLPAALFVVTLTCSTLSWTWQEPSHDNKAVTRESGGPASGQKLQSDCKIQYGSSQGMPSSQAAIAGGGCLGIEWQPMTQAIAKLAGMAETRGIFIQNVQANSPAAKAGLEEADVILELNRHPIQNGATDFSAPIRSMEAGTAVRLTIYRRGQEQELSAEVGEFTGNTPLKGAQIGNLTPENIQRWGLPPDAHGVVVIAVEPKSPAAEHLEPGDVIEEVNGARLSNVAEYAKAVRQAGNNIQLRLERSGKTWNIFLMEGGPGEHK